MSVVFPPRPRYDRDTGPCVYGTTCKRPDTVFGSHAPPEYESSVPDAPRASMTNKGPGVSSVPRKGERGGGGAGGRRRDVSSGGETGRWVRPVRVHPTSPWDPHRLILKRSRKSKMTYVLRVSSVQSTFVSFCSPPSS